MTQIQKLHASLSYLDPMTISSEDDSSESSVRSLSNSCKSEDQSIPVPPTPVKKKRRAAIIGPDWNTPYLTQKETSFDFQSICDYLSQKEIAC